MSGRFPVSRDIREWVEEMCRRRWRGWRRAKCEIRREIKNDLVNQRFFKKWKSVIIEQGCFLTLCLINNLGHTVALFMTSK